MAAELFRKVYLEERVTYAPRVQDGRPAGNDHVFPAGLPIGWSKMPPLPESAERTIDLGIPGMGQA